MKIIGIIQAVALMLIIALAASCATSNQYVSKIFGPRPEQIKKDTQQVAFLTLDSSDAEVTVPAWVTQKEKEDTAIAEKSTPIVSEPVVKNEKTEGVRTKKKRD
jgi:hypothetical protein